MGKQKYQREIEQFIENSPVVSYASIERIVTSKKKVKQYVKQLIRHLVRQGTLKPLLKGYYTSRDDASLAVFCVQPAYLGLQDALSYHNLWEQETIPIIITTRKVRTGIRTVLESNVLIRRVEPKYYFGIVHSTGNKVALPYSDIEKTFIDMVHFKQKINPEMIKEFRKRIDHKKLKQYLQHYPEKVKKKILTLLRYREMR